MATGLEIAGAIGATVGLVGAAIDVYKNARKGIKLSSEMVLVMNRLPVLMATLQTCQEHFSRVQTKLPEGQALLDSVHDCREKAAALEAIFKNVIPGDEAGRWTRYRMAVARFGNGNKVEDLAKFMAENTQTLVNHHVVRSLRPDLGDQLAQVVQELGTPARSMAEIDYQMQNKSNTPVSGPVSGRLYQNTHSGSGTVHYHGDIAGDATFHFSA